MYNNKFKMEIKGQNDNKQNQNYNFKNSMTRN